MFRLLGFIIGSASSIAIILLVTGIPEFHVEDPEIDQKRFDEAVEKLVARRSATNSDTKPPTQEYEGDEIGAMDKQAATVAEKSSEEAVATDTQPGTDLADATPDTLQAESNPADVNSAQFDASITDLQWHSFWNPFRSEIAANGFVAQLENVTGLDYRVVRVTTGVYEVAFAYVDDEERRYKLSQISLATGLDLPDS